MKKCDVAECRINYVNPVTPNNRVKITSSKATYDLMFDKFSGMDHVEEFAILLLNRGNNALGWKQISKGGVSGTLVDPKVIYQAAILANASAVILLHNHPSGNLKPSRADIDITKKIQDCAKLLDMNVLDHIIVSRFGYYSFADEGLM